LDSLFQVTVSKYGHGYWKNQPAAAEIREQVNQKLDAGEPGNRLVAWVNGLPTVPGSAGGGVWRHRHQ